MLAGYSRYFKSSSWLSKAVTTLPWVLPVYLGGWWGGTKFLKFNKDFVIIMDLVPLK